MNTSELIDKRIAELGDWRGEMLASLRKLIRSASPELSEEWKWDTPIWSSNGNVVAIGAFKDHIKINFFYGALLDDHSLFNAGLDAKTTRSIDIFETDKINKAALKNLIRAAVALNNTKSKVTTKRMSKPVAKTKSKKQTN